MVKSYANGEPKLWVASDNEYSQLGLGEGDANAYINQTRFVKNAIKLEYVLVIIEWSSLTYEYNAKWVQNGNKPLWKATATNADRIKVTNSSSGNINVVLEFQVSDEYAASGKNGTVIEETFVTTSFGDKITGVEDLQNQTFGVVTATLQDPDVQQSNP